MFPPVMFEIAYRWLQEGRSEPVQDDLLLVDRELGDEGPVEENQIITN